MMIYEGLGNYALLILRLVLGIIFLYHGLPKLKGKMGGFMVIIGILEGLAGLAVMAGLYTEIAGSLLAVIMVGAIFKKVAQWNIPFSSQGTTGWEFDLTLAAAAIALAFLGAGNLSVDSYLGYFP